MPRRTRPSKRSARASAGLCRDGERARSTLVSIAMTAAIDLHRALTQADVERLAPLVRRIAMRLARRLPNHVGIDDLMSCGWVGLAEAFARTNSAMSDDELEAYASQRVRGAMLDHLRSLDRASRQTRQAARRLTSTVGELTQSLGRQPETEEVAAALGIDLDTYHQLVESTARVAAPHLELADHRPASVPSTTSPAAEVEQRMLSERVAEAIQSLPPRLQQVLALYYQESCTLKEIGAILGVTESRICQLHADAVRRLRGAVAA